MNGERKAIGLDDAPTLADLFRVRCQLTPQGLAYIQYRDGDWRNHSWAETRDAVARWQHALQNDGLKAGDRVAIMCSNRWEWVLLDQAVQSLGLVTVPIYTNDRAENIGWILEDSGARVLVLESRDQWQALAADAVHMDSLVRIVCLEKVPPDRDNLASLHDWLGDESAEYHCSPGDPDSLATIVYTSGTTGRPKGVMLTHRNILTNIQAALDVFAVYDNDILLSFLPLSHALERTVGYYLAVTAGSATAYNRDIPLLADDLVAVKPTLMISVPRIFERVYGKIHDKLATESRIKQALFNKAVEVGYAYFLFEQQRGPWKISFLVRPVLDALVGSKVRDKLGGRLRFTVCGGAALAPDVAKLFIGLGIPVVQGYGLTETSPIIAANPLENNVPSSVGLPMPGIEVKLGKDNELLTRSQSVMLGYWNNPDATKEIIDPDGWLHTGDIVDIAPSGHITITGRSKDIIVLANGEKVPPSDMENAIVLDELVDQVVIIGEGKPYLSALIVPNPEAFERLARQRDLDPADNDSYRDATIVQQFLTVVQKRTERFPGYADVHEVAIVKEPWTPDNGYATPTLKLRRNKILERFSDTIDQLYAGH